MRAADRHLRRRGHPPVRQRADHPAARPVHRLREPRPQVAAPLPQARAASPRQQGLPRPGRRRSGIIHRPAGHRPDPRGRRRRGCSSASPPTSPTCSSSARSTGCTRPTSTRSSAARTVVAALDAARVKADCALIIEAHAAARDGRRLRARSAPGRLEPVHALAGVRLRHHASPGCRSGRRRSLPVGASPAVAWPARGARVAPRTGVGHARARLAVGGGHRVQPSSEEGTGHMSTPVSLRGG